MKRGELFNVFLDGVRMTICVIGSYHEELSGEEMVVLALIGPENTLYIPLSDFNIFFPNKKSLN